MESYDSIRTRARFNRIPISSDQTMIIIQQILHIQRPHYCLEIGSAIGRGSIHIASHIQLWGGHLFSFEISYPTYHTALHIGRQFSCHNTTIYHSSFLSAPIDKLLPKTLDFVYIDGSKKEYTHYFLTILPFLGSHSICVFDDVIAYHDKIGDLQKHLCSHHWHYTYFDTEPGDGVLIASHKNTLLPVTISI